MKHYLNLDKIYEAEEIPVLKDGDLKLPLNELVTRQYDRRFGRYGTDWVTEFNYVCEESLTQDQFVKIIEDSGQGIYGEIKFIKRKLTFGNGKVYYRHICECVMY